MDPEIPVFLVCIVMSAFFSGTEVAMLSANRLKLRRKIAEGDLAAKRILDLVNHPRRLLAGILVGNNIFNVLSSAVLTSYCIRKFGEDSALAITVATFVATTLLVIFGEYLPKTVAALHPIRFAKRVVNPMRFLIVVLSPAVIPLEAVTRPLGRLLSHRAEGYGLSDVRMAVSEGVRTGNVDETMEQVLRGSLSLEWKTVADVLIPRVDVERVDHNATFLECRKVFRREGFSRLMVMDENPDNDLGYVAAKDLTMVREEDRPGWRVKDSLREALRVPASLPLLRLLARMRMSGVHFAVVKDEYGGTEGIVTLEDVLEELVGEIRDEHDDAEVPPVIKIRTRTWMVRGDVSVKDLLDRLEMRLEAIDARTVGGLVAEELGRLPAAGDKLEIQGLRLKVLGVEGNRVLRVRVEQRQPPSDEDD
mgnify:CR=1 FL=1